MEDNTLEFMDTRGHNFYKENLESQIAELTKEIDELTDKLDISTSIFSEHILEQDQIIFDQQVVINKDAQEISDLKAQVERLREGINPKRYCKFYINDSPTGCIYSGHCCKNDNSFLTEGSKEG